jgi:hypothetical protein
LTLRMRRRSLIAAFSITQLSNYTITKFAVSLA